MAVLLSENKIQSALGRLDKGNINIISKSSVQEFADERESLTKTDKVLQELGPESENINEVVFGLEPQWMTDGALDFKRKPFLKKLTESLSLEPIGFVLTTESLNSHLQGKDKMLSAIVLYLQREKLYLSLFKQGKIIKKIDIGRSGDMIADLNEGLARLVVKEKKEDQFFPAKMILASYVLDRDEVKKHQQSVLGYSWTDNFPFLQMPQVEVLGEEILIEAITTQGGRAVAKSRGFDIQEDKNSLSPVIKGDNIAVAEPGASSFGVPFNPNKIHSGIKQSHKEDSKIKIKNKTSKKIKKPPSIFSFKKGQKITHKQTIFFSILSGLFAVVLIGFFYLMFAAKVIINITLSTQTISKEVELILDPLAEKSNPKELILSASIVEKKLTEDDSWQASGIKLVGEKATGKVTFYNKTDSEKTFTAGTTITSGSLKFTINEDVKVASASVKEKDGGETKEYGKSEGQVTAAEIGADSNLEKDVSLQIENYNSNTYSSTINDGLSGGSSREIRVVSQKDQDDLLDEITKALLNQAEEEFKDESGDGRYVVPTGEIEYLKKKFSDEVGEEADTISLELTAKIQAVVYLTEDLKPLAVEVLSDEIPEGYELMDQEPEILSSPLEEASRSSKLKLIANISSKVRPLINTDVWRDDIVGKSLDQALNNLKSKKEIKDVDIQFWPSMSSLFKKIPKKIENINFEVKE